MAIEPGCVATYYQWHPHGPAKKFPVRVIGPWGRTKSGFLMWRVERLDLPKTAPKMGRILRVADYSLTDENQEAPT